MCGWREIAALGMAAALTSVAVRVRADAPGEAPSRDAWPLHLRLDGYAGLVTASRDGIAAGGGAATFVGIGALQTGVSVLGETQALGYSRINGAVHLGACTAPAAVVFDAMATAGLARMHRQGGFFIGDPGASGSVWFLGARAGLGIELIAAASGDTQLNLDFTGFFEHDMNPHTVIYTYAARDWLLGGGATEEMGSARIGGERAGLLVGVSATFR